MDLTLDDLMENCGECEGTGKKEQPPSPPVNSSFGRQEFSPSGGSNECESCGGSGKYKPTASGQAILDFIKYSKGRV